MSDWSADDERRATKLFELVSGLLVVVAMQMSKTFPGQPIWLYTAYIVVLFNALAVVVAGWAAGRNNSAVHKGVNQSKLIPSIQKQLCCKGTVYKQGFNPRLSLVLPFVAAVMQVYAVNVETFEPGVFEDWVAALSIALAMSLPAILEACSGWFGGDDARFCAGAVAEADCGKDWHHKRFLLVLRTEDDGYMADLGVFATKEHAQSYWQNVSAEDPNVHEPPIKVHKAVSIGNRYRHTSHPLNVCPNGSTARVDSPRTVHAMV